MKPFVIALVLTAVSSAVMGQSRNSTRSMSCAQARGVIATQGAVVLHTGPNTYDRYVRDAGFCAAQEMVRPAWVPTADTAQCPIGGVCRSVEIDNGR